MYTDGACPGNNNKGKNHGGWGVYLEYNGRTLELHGGESSTTNNRMEIQAVIEGIKALTTVHIPVDIYTDSAYVLHGITDWIKGWKENNWKTAKGSDVKNKDLWEELDELVSKLDDVKVIKVKGHSGVEGNEIADKLAVKGAVGE